MGDGLIFFLVLVRSTLLSVSGDSSARVTPVPTSGTGLTSETRLQSSLCKMSSQEERSKRECFLKQTQQPIRKPKSLLVLCFVCVCVIGSLANLPPPGGLLPHLHPGGVRLVPQLRLVLPVSSGQGAGRSLHPRSPGEEDLAASRTRWRGRENRVIEQIVCTSSVFFFFFFSHTLSFCA